MKKALFRLGNILLIVFLTACILIADDQRITLFSHLDFSAYQTMADVPKLGSITNNREARIEFYTGGYELSDMRVFLRIDAQGKLDLAGKLHCILEHDGEELEEIVVPVRNIELLAQRVPLSMHNGLELNFHVGERLDGYCTLVIRGEGIGSTVRISLLGEEGLPNDLSLVSEPERLSGLFGLALAKPGQMSVYGYAAGASVLVLLAELGVWLWRRKR